MDIEFLQEEIDSGLVAQFADDILVREYPLECLCARWLEGFYPIHANHIFRHGALLLINVTLFESQVRAQEPDQSAGFIRLQSRTFQPDAGIESSISQRMTQSTSVQHVLVQLHSIPTSEERAALRADGMHLLAYIPDRAWLATVRGNVAAGRQVQRQVRWIGPLLPEDKLSPALQDRGVASWSLEENGQVRLQLLFFEDVSSITASTLVSQYQGQVELIGQDNRYVVVFPSADVIYQLASEDIVQWVDNGPAPRRLRDAAPVRRTSQPISYNNGARERTNVNALQTAQPGANGAGTRLGVWDGGVDPGHPDFTGRLWVDPNHSDPSNEHGTHVAGTMAGDGRNSTNQGGTADEWRGIATAAQIYSYDNQGPFFDDHQGAIQTNNIDLSQNSWGGNFTSDTCDTHNIYSLDAQQMDRIVSGETYGKGIISSVAASNFREGTSDDQDDPYPVCGYSDQPPFLNYMSLSDLGSAKNILSVGATLKNDQDLMTDFSSWGPTRDGRLKPDLVAPGQDIVSSVPGGGYGPSSGTSMATPHISGIAALIIQRYRAVFNTQTFRPATIRAIMIQTARDLDAEASYYTPGPDYASGYGIADALAAYNFVSNNKILEDTIAQGATDTQMINVSNSNIPLKVTLVWDDPAAQLNAAIRLVNNLDLELVAPDGTTVHLPWILDATSPSDAATTGVDSLNNVEQVYVANPTTGIWTVRVKGTSVPQGPQQYSVVFSVNKSTGSGSVIF
ncbi:MAG: S8 family serine peptidase, partial [Pseudomonadota bacterium]